MLTGKDLEQLFKNLEITMAKLNRTSGVSIPAIQRVFADDPKVKDATRLAVQVSLERLAKEKQGRAAG
jgi:predicted transcriptional regulator